MEDIRIYNFEFQPLHVENYLMSVNWEIYYNDVGTFEAHFPLNSKVVEIVTKQRYLVMVQGEKAAIVTGVMLAEDCAVYGRTCNWLLTKRVTPSFEAVTANAEQFARQLVGDAFSDVNTFTLGPLAGVTDQVSLTQEKYEQTFQTVQGCLDSVGAGHEVAFRPDSGQWVFQVTQGASRSLVVSEANRNASDTSYNGDLLDYASGGWYQYQAETPEGQQRPDPVWTYLTKDTTKSGIYKWDTVLSKQTENEAKMELSGCKNQQTITASTHDLRWGIDYQLGDRVSVQLIKGSYKSTQEERIIGVRIWYEENETGEEPILEEE